jgi:small basic protein
LPNGLSDVTKRENRFLHNFSGAVSASAFPYENVLANISSGTLAGNRIGEDIVLSNVLAFDVRVFDPAAEVLKLKRYCHRCRCHCWRSGLYKWSSI